MKTSVIGIVGLSVFLLGPLARAENWYPVLKCAGTVADGWPTVEVDNMASNTGGRDPMPATVAQVVIRDPKTVQSFIGSLHMQPTEFAPFTNAPVRYSGDGYSVEEGQWIGFSGGQTFPAGEATISFTESEGQYGSSVGVSYDGSKLTISVTEYGDWNHDVTATANASFDNCGP